MRRKFYDQSSQEEPPRKKSSTELPPSSGLDLKEGEIVSDIGGKRWRLGKPIGIGGFGEIYEASDNAKTIKNKTDSRYVAKIEKHSNGPLFVEINCYLRIGRKEMIKNWKKDAQVKFLGMPHYIASGSHLHQGEKFRFLIMDRYEKDLEKILHQKKKFNSKTVLTISSQILDVLQYIHSKGYVHSDIKASNIMLSKEEHSKPSPKVVKCKPLFRNCRVDRKRRRKRAKFNLRPTSSFTYVDDIPYLEDLLDVYNEDFASGKESEVKTDFTDRAYLLDYGLASRYVDGEGRHRPFNRDERKAHAGTVLFCSRDAHQGVASRRSDLESLGYNMVYWLTGSLPWIDYIAQPEIVEKKKVKCLRNIEPFLEFCFAQNFEDFPEFLYDYFNYVNELQFEENPDYDYCRSLFKTALKESGFLDDSKLDFEELQSPKSAKVKKKVSKSKKKQSSAVQSKMLKCSFLTSPLRPLDSNAVHVRQKLRKKEKDKKEPDSAMNWSKILITDPELILKQAVRERKTTEGSDPGVQTLSPEDLESMNPTYAMLEVFNKYQEKSFTTRHKGDSIPSTENIQGYTPAMMTVHARMKQRQEYELELEAAAVLSQNQTKRKTRSSKRIQNTKAVNSASRVSSRKRTGSDHQSIKEVKKSKSVSLKRTYTLRG